MIVAPPLRRIVLLFLAFAVTASLHGVSTQGETGPAKAGAAQNDQAPQGDSIPHGAVEPVVQRWDVGALAPAVPRGLIAYHPATNRLLTLQDAGAVLWDIVTGLAIRGFAADGLKSPHVTVIAFSPDGSRLLLGGRTRLRLHDAHRGEVLVEFDTEGRSILDADLSPDGQLIAAACDDAVVRIWDAHNGSLQRQLREHRWTLTHVRFSPDSSQLLSGGTDRLAVLWDVKSGRLIHRLASPTDVRGTAFSSDGKRLLTYGSGEYWHTVRAVVWDRASGLPLQMIPRPLSNAWFDGGDVVLLQPDGERLRWPADRHVFAPDPEDFPRSQASPFPLQVSKDHWTLRSEENESEAVLRGPDGETVPLRLRGRSADDQLPLEFSADGRWLVTGGGYRASGNRCVVWDLHEGRLHRRLIPGALARFDSDSTRIAIAHYQTITLFDLASGEVLRTLKIDKGSVESLQFVAGGSRLLTASGNWYDGDQGQLLLWDIKSGRRLKSYAPMDKAVTFAQATPDEQRIVATFTRGDAGSAGVDQISVFDSASGERISNLDLSSDLFGGTLLDPQGEFIISGGNSRSGVLLWDLKTLEPRHRFPLHLAALSPDGQVLATHDDRRRLRFWNTDTGEQVGMQVLPLGRVWGQAGVSQFHPGGRLYVGSTTVATRRDALLGRSIGFWNLQSGALEAELLTFDDGREWLIQTAAGCFSGSEEGLRRVAWRRAGTDSIKIDRPRTDEQHQPRRVAETLSQSLTEEQPLIEMLAALPEGPPESVPEPAVKPFQPFQIDLEMRRETIRAFERAGGDVQADIHGYIRSLYMEQRPLNQELIERFAWVRSTERLYLAATGITDDQLEWVGMMGNVRRLSLWGNPITDAGMKHLATLWNLEVLDIHDTAVTAEGLNRLRLLEKMKTLIVPSSVDVAALEPLRRIPNLEIIRRGSRE